MYAPRFRIGRRRVAEAAVHTERSIEEVHQRNELRCGQTFQDLYVLIHLLDGLFMNGRSLRADAVRQIDRADCKRGTEAEKFEHMDSLSLRHKRAFPFLDKFRQEWQLL